MMVKPVSYLQRDVKWGNMDYSAPGENTTVGKSGCGITCMAMVIATIKNPNITPIDTAKWSLANGYKAPYQGTYYSYFVPQGNLFGINVSKVNTTNIYKLTSTNAKAAHAKALQAVKNGNWVIACMGKGNWTTSGHYILWYGVSGLNALINDPYSTRTAQTNASIALLQSQVKYYWIVEVPQLYMTEAKTLVTEIQKKITISDTEKLAFQLNVRYNGSCWWIIKKLLEKDYTNAIPIVNGRTDIYRRTLLAISVSDTAKFNSELISMGNNSIFWVIKKLLDRLGIA